MTIFDNYLNFVKFYKLMKLKTVSKKIMNENVVAN